MGARLFIKILINSFFKFSSVYLTISSSIYLTKLDLSKGYWQIPVAAEDIPKTALVTPDGSHEFVKMPFGMIPVQRW